MNAATSQETTSYFVTLLQEDWRLGVDVLSDIVQNSIFPQEEIARERDVVLQEVDQTEDAPDEVVFELAQKLPSLTRHWGVLFLGRKRISAPLTKRL
ncbi:MAG: insulinase family protein [Holosporaceae bacterium]|nr:MAG: insulinase family protein [Holosporaceae bacterium]